jgi:alkanesulfonate monooxygenase SsuD/methylene tetrahydromethanopterin reductase-like flavin-dependent oxidoreductase (luciferase family)
MRLGVVILPERRWRDAAAVWQRAEALGFDHAWTYDHLAWRSLRDETWFATIPTLTAAAAATTRIRLGPLVATPNFRHPVPFAKELMTLDDMSEGRLTVGLGAGSDGWDATMLGQTPWSRRERADRFAEFIECLDVVLRERAPSFDGRYYAADEARTIPGCVQQPRMPFAVAGIGRRGMALAARFGAMWVTTGDRVREGPLNGDQGAAIVGEQIRRLNEECAAANRDRSSLRRVVVVGAQLDAGLGSFAQFADTLGAYDAVGVTDVAVHWPRAEGPFAGDIDTFERVVGSRAADREHDL